MLTLTDTSYRLAVAGKFENQAINYPLLLPKFLQVI